MVWFVHGECVLVQEGGSLSGPTSEQTRDVLLLISFVQAVKMYPPKRVSSCRAEVFSVCVSRLIVYLLNKICTTSSQKTNSCWVLLSWDLGLKYISII